MTLLFTESFDWTTTVAQLLRKWTSTSFSTTNSSTIGAYGATDNALRVLRDAGSFDYMNWLKGLGSSPSTLITGTRFKQDNIAVTSGVEYLDGSTIHVGWYSNTNGSISVRRGGAGGTILGTTVTGLLSSTVWSYIEFKATIHDTTGVVVLKVNGVEVLNLTNQDTRNGANAQVTSLQIYNIVANTVGTYWDDIYICDTNGAVNNDFLGDVAVKRLLPSGAGNSTDFTPSAGSNYACVDEAAVNDDTDYVQSTTVGHKDLYAFGDLPTGTWVIKGVAVNLQAKKPDAGSRTARALTRTGATDYEGGDLSVGIAYANLQTFFETNPNTGVAWTHSEVDGAEFGEKVQA